MHRMHCTLYSYGYIINVFVLNAILLSSVDIGIFKPGIPFSRIIVDNITRISNVLSTHNTMVLQVLIR